jgi:SAM-dependent methyltransferase
VAGCRDEGTIPDGLVHRVNLDVPESLWRTAQPDFDGWIRSAAALLDLIPRSFGLADLSATSVLDVGCGTKLVKCILEREVPLRRYVGVDASSEVIAFLDANVDDPRFSFHHLDAHNDRYNPTGQPLESFDHLPVGDERFDIICLFSVFTHLGPTDYRTMLELLRPHVDAGGGLLFSLFVDDDPDPVASATMNKAIEARLAAGDPGTQAAVARAMERRAVAGDGPVDFADHDPDQPMLRAGYSERYARELIDGSGWEVIGLHPPELPHIQHYFVCRAV